MLQLTVFNIYGLTNMNMALILFQYSKYNFSKLKYKAHFKNYIRIINQMRCITLLKFLIFMLKNKT